MSLKKHLVSLLSGAILAGLGLVLAGPAAAAYPDKPVRFVVPFPPAGATDALGRLIADNLSKIGGQPFIIENRAGAGGNLGMESMLRQSPDGYTIGMITTAHAINMGMPQKPNFKIPQDLTPVSLLASSRNVVVVNNQLPVHSLKELIAYGRSDKNKLSFGSAGTGTSTHLAGELFKQRTGVKMLHVPYRGAGPALIDLIGGNVQVMFAAISSVEGQIRHGDVRALAITSAKRSETLPDIPTFAEAGVQDFVVEGWLGVVAPANLSPEALKWLDTNIRQVLARPDVIKAIQALGLVASHQGPDEFGRFMSSEVATWSNVIDHIDPASE